MVHPGPPPLSCNDDPIHAAASSRGASALLQQLFKLLIRQPRVSDDGLERVGIKSFVARDRHTVKSVRQADVFAFVDHFESDLAEGANDPFGREVGEKHLDRHTHLGGFLASRLFLDHEKVGSDRVFDVLQGFL